MVSRRIMLGGSAAVIVIAGMAFAAQAMLPQAPLQQIESDVFQEVWFVPDADATDVEVHLVFDRGEMDNPYAEGLAHYVEHLAWLSAFDGDESARHSNAWTTISATGYWRTTKPDALGPTVEQLVKVAAPFTRDTDFMLEERNIVQREYELRVGEWPLHPVFDEMQRVLYEDGPLARSVIGNKEDIARYALADAQALHADSHKLRHATLVVTGPVRARDVKAAIKNVMPDEPGADAVIQTFNTTPFRDVQDVTVPGLTQQSLAYRKIIPLENCGLTARCDYIIAVLMNALDSTLDGGLAGPLRFDNFIAESFSIWLSRPDEAHLEISFDAVPDRGVSLDALLEAFEAALSETISTGLPPETFARTKARLVSDVEKLENDPAYLAGLVLDLTSAGWPVHDWDAAWAAVQGVTEDDVAKVLEQMAAPGRVVIRKARIANE